MRNTARKIGKVIKPSNTDPWPHEERAADILAESGYYVEFLPRSSSSPDILLNNVEYEMKSPKSHKANSMEQLIKDALYKKKCPNIVFDSLRLKGVRDEEIERFLISQVKRRKAIKNMLFINKHHRVIDICKLV